MANVIDTSERVHNTKRRFGQAANYYPADIIMGGRRMPALFTWAQLAEAINRASGNPEDVPRPTWWERAKRWFLG